MKTSRPRMIPASTCEGRVGIDAERERWWLRWKRSGCGALLGTFWSCSRRLRLLLLNLGQNTPKVLGVFFHFPPDQISIPLPPGVLIQRVPYMIRFGSRIAISGLHMRRRGLGRDGHWDPFWGRFWSAVGISSYWLLAPNWPDVRLLVLPTRPFPRGRVQRSYPKEGRQNPPRLGFFNGEIQDSRHRGGEVFPNFHRRGSLWIPLPIPPNRPIEKADDDRRGYFGVWVVGR